MATPFEDIYTRFLMIDDYELGLISEEELRDVLYRYLKSGIDHFPQCEKDLSKVIFVDEVPHFESDLSSNEKRILSMCMRREWMISKLYNVDNMQKSIGDRDYRAIQGTGYLKSLSELDDKLEDEIRTYSVAYTYEDFSLEDW